MEQNEILAEIRAIREQHAKECNYDIETMFKQMRIETERLKAEGWKIVEPPKKKKAQAVKPAPHNMQK